ncbi:MAG: glycosyltransferase family 39 protein [Calothrix sp. C42_A2020_038]|nr:glycosyltransferase family 39 protein [Calothrix sp. C42_A2020_038]
MKHLRIAPSWLRYFIVVVLVLGMCFRFINLDSKVFWHDETFTMLRVSGYTTTEVKQQVFNGRVIGNKSLAKFQSINDNKNLSNTINSLALEDPQYPPLYYILARAWVTIFGDSVTAIRCLSAVISLLLIPCMYWLCYLLFKVPLGAPVMAVVLTITSPLLFVYSQEAREYILWAVMILLSSSCLLRALQLQISQSAKYPVFNWGIYALSLALSMYTFLLSGFVAIAHIIYVIVISKFRWTKTVEAFCTAIVVSFLFASPWLIIVLTNFSRFNITTEWTMAPLPLGNLIQSWLLQLTRIFFDLDWNLDNIFQYITALFFLSLVSYAIYFLCITTNIKVWLFIITLIFVPALPLVLPDLIFGGMRSVSERYLIPSYLGIIIAVAYLLCYQVNNGILSRRQNCQIITVTVITLGLISIAVSSQSETWWNKVVSYGNPEVARIINQESRPLLISDDAGINYGNVFSLTYLFEPKVRLLLVQENRTVPRVSNQTTSIFILNPSNRFRRDIERVYKSRTNRIYSDRYYSVYKLQKTV